MVEKMKKNEEKDKWRMWVLVLYFFLALQILFVIAVFTLPGFYDYINSINSYYGRGLPQILSGPFCAGVDDLNAILEITGGVVLVFSLVLCYIKKEIKFLAIFLFEILFSLSTGFFFACL